jgi:hypothetical protein
MKWRKEEHRVMKQKNITREDALNREIWRKAIEKRVMGAKVETSQIDT